MKIIFTILLYAYLIVGALAQEARKRGMSESAFSTLKENLATSLDTSKIDMLRNLNSETYSSYQVKEILESFSLGNYRVEAFKIISTQIDDTENKSIIMSAFQNDLSNYKTDAYKIYNSIRAIKKKEVTEETTVPLSGNISLLKIKSNCANDENTFTMADNVIFSFSANKAVEATNLQIWISECKNQNDQSCYTPFSKSAKDILPDWRGFKYENPIPLKQLLSNDGNNSVPTRNNWYHFAVIINNKIAAERVYQINKTCE